MQDLKERFERSVHEHSDKDAIWFKKAAVWTSVTYGSLANSARTVAGFLCEAGIKKGDRVAIIMKNRPEWPAIFFAIAAVGAVSVPLNSAATKKEVDNILNDSGCNLVFSDEDTFSLVRDVPERCRTVEKVVCVDSDEFSSIGQKFSEQLPFPEIKSEDTACILYTSGTTAEPKGVMLSHTNLISNCDSQHKLGLVSDKEKVVSVLPLHHVYPLTITMILPILAGSMIIYPESMRPEALLDAMKGTGATVFAAVPQIFTSFHQKIAAKLQKIPFPLNFLFKFVVEALYWIRQRTGINLSRYFLYSVHSKFGMSMKMFTSGGAKLDETVEKDLFKFGFTILEGYGLTETSPVLTSNPIKKPKIGSAGVAIPDVEVKIVDKNEDGIGEVVARGPNIMKGYYKREDLTKKAIKDGWFHTGDLGYFDDEEYLFLTGRSKDVIVLTSGMNVYPDEVEEAYMRDAPVKEMCVFEIPSGKGQEETLALWAVVVPDIAFFKKYGEVNIRDVIKERFNNVSQTLPGHMRLMNFFITLEELPRTLLGKIKRYEVKGRWAVKAAEEDRPEEEKKVSEEDLAMMKTGPGEMILDYLKKQTGVKAPIVPNDLLEIDLGIDSLGRIELASGLEKVLGVTIKDEIIGEAFTVRDLIKGIESLLSEERIDQTRKEEIKIIPTGWKENLRDLPRKENLERIDLNPGFIVWLVDFLFLLPILIFFKIFYSLKVEGRENIPKEGSYILYVNHASYFDGFLVGVSLPRFPKLDLFFVGFRPYFTVPIIRNLVKIGRIIPLDFSTHLLEAMKSCYYVLENGKNLCLFPEGLRTLDGEIEKFKKGFGILAKESGAKLVPVILDGAYEAWPRTAKFPKRHPIKVKFGKPLTPEVLEEQGCKAGVKDSYAAICLAAREVLTELKEQN